MRASSSLASPQLPRRALSLISPLTLAPLTLALLALSLLASSCAVEVSLADKACGDGHDCIDGYVCVAGRCREEGTATHRDAGADDDDAGPVDGGADGDDAGTLADAGPQPLDDAGALDAGAEDAGTEDAGADDAGADDADAGAAGNEDAGADDAGGSDAGQQDAGSAGEPDAGGDAGPIVEQPYGTGRDGPLDVTSDFTLNVCRPLVSSNDDSVTLGAATGIEAGMLVLLWQVQDTFAVVADGADIPAPGEAGLLEIVRISSRQGPKIFTDPAPSRAYRSGNGAVAQVCSLPEHTTVVIRTGSKLLAEPWNGSVGGVVAFLASDGVVIEDDGRIDASERGFRGGLVDVGVNDVDHVTAEITDRESGGQKGEGLDPTAVGLYGRGNYANGGGGGNAHNGGGGGGGNGGRGGKGGIEWADGETPNPSTGGRAGARVVGLDRVSLGGGGGAAEMHHTGGDDGGNGGGLVLVMTPSLAGAGSIRADGSSALTGEAGSGGGAGGTILLLTPSAAGFTGSVRARGGDGGGADEGLGPGGGGGGGVIVGPALPDADVEGGQNGVTLDDQARDAASGEDGVVSTL